MIIRATKWTYEDILNSPDELISNLPHVWAALDQYDKEQSKSKGSRG